MYDELVERLRDCRNMAVLSEFWWDITTEAADAIEELQKVANKLLAKYQEEATSVIWECSGNIEQSLNYLHEEIRTLQAQIDGEAEPPKEGKPK